MRLGVYDFAREWSLDGKPRRPGEAPVRECPECGALVPLAARVCPECGTVFEPQGRTIEEAAGELVELDAIALELRLIPYRQALDWARYDPDRLRLVAAARGYKPGWVYHRLRGQNAAP